MTSYIKERGIGCDLVCIDAGILFVKTGQTVVCKVYNERAREIKCAPALFSFILSIAALIGWGILYGITFSFEPSVLWWALVYGFLYFLGTIGFMYAPDYGPPFLTNLFITLSSIGVVIWGFFFLERKDRSVGHKRQS